MASGVKASSEVASMLEIVLPHDYTIIQTPSGDHVYFSTMDHQKGLVFSSTDQPILLNDFTMAFWLDRAGRKGHMLGSKMLTISSEDDPNCWEWSAHPDSRFLKVGKLQSVWSLYIEGELEADNLSKNVPYGVYFVYKIAKQSRNLDSLNVYATIARDGTAESNLNRTKHSKVDLYEGRKREDGWLEIQVGEVEIDEKKHADHDVKIYLWNDSSTEKSGLIVEGIALRPYLSKTADSDEVDDLAKHQRFWLDEKTKKIWVMAGSQSLSIEYINDPSCWHWTTDRKSRFSKVAELIKMYRLEIKGKIKSERLSKNTKYRANLVYQIKEANKNLKKSSVLTALNNDYTDDEVNLYEGKNRADGWKEVTLGEIKIAADNENSGFVTARLWNHDVLEPKEGLVIEGIELQPLE